MQNIIKIKDKIPQWISSLKNKMITVRNNRDLLVFLLFILLATALWFLNALRKEYTTVISYPVHYSDFPDDFILLGEPQNKIQLKIKSLGYTALPYHMGKILSPETLNVSNFRRINSEKNQGAYILTKDLFQNFSDNLTNGIELVDIYPDTLFVRFEKKQRKMVPVIFKSQLNFKPQYYQSGNIKIEPDSVEVSGPGSIIDTLQCVYTENKRYVELSDKLVRNMALVTGEHIESNPARVVVEIPVEAFTEKMVKIPLQHINVPDSLRLKTFPADVNVSFTVAVSRFNTLSSKDFVAQVDYKASSPQPGLLPDRLKVKIAKSPEGIKNIDYSPLFVDCLFEKIK